MKRKRKEKEKLPELPELKKRKISLTNDEKKRFEEFWKSKESLKNKLLQELPYEVRTNKDFNIKIKEKSKEKWYDNIRGTNIDKILVIEKKFKDVINKLNDPIPKDLENKRDYILLMIEKMDYIQKSHKICYDMLKLANEIDKREDNNCFEKLTRSLDIAMESNNVQYEEFKKYLKKMV